MSILISNLVKLWPLSSNFILKSRKCHNIAGLRFKLNSQNYSLGKYPQVHQEDLEKGGRGLHWQGWWGLDNELIGWVDHSGAVASLDQKVAIVDRTVVSCQCGPKLGETNLIGPISGQRTKLWQLWTIQWQLLTCHCGQNRGHWGPNSG